MNKEEQIDKIINNHVLYSMGLGIIPIPLVDIAAVTATQLDMLSQIGGVHGKNFSDISGKSFIASTAGATFARLGASFIKAIPGIGSLLGGVSMSIMSGASTYAIGQVAHRFFRDGLELEDIDADLAKSIYEEEFEKGKKVASDLKAKKDNDTEETDSSEEIVTEAGNTPDDEKTDLYDQLLKLGDLKEKGVITAEEFEEMKKKIVAKF
jgi:uncharacterized protein (DUF697 family)